MRTNNVAFLRALDGPAGLANKRTPLPVLNCVKLSALSGRLTIAGTSIDAYCEMSVDCEGDLEPTCVHAARLRQLLGDFGDGDVSLNLSANGKRLELSGRHNAKLPTVDVDEFPAGKEPTGTEIMADLKDMAAGIAAVQWCINAEPDRPTLHGVNVRGNEICATTGRAVAIYTIAADIGNIDLFIPTYAVDMIQDALTKDGARLTLGETQIFVTFDGGMFAAKRPEGQFPNYRNVIPQDAQRIGALDRDTLVSTVRPAVSMYDAIYAKTRLEFGANGCVVSQDANLGEFESTIAGEFKPLRFAVNGLSLIRAANKFENGIEVYGIDDMAPLMLKGGNLTVILCALKW